MSDLTTIVAEAAGIYGACPTCHLSALARLENYAIGDLERAVGEERSLVRVRAMRRSVHLIGRERLPVVLAATRKELLRSYRAKSKKLGFDYEQAAAGVERALAEGPRSSSEIRAEVDPDREMGWRFSVLLARMAADCRLVRASTTGSWRSDRLTYALWKDRLDEVDPFALDEREARLRLAEDYAGAYGPVELEDLAWWTGWSKTDARAIATEVDLSRHGSALDRLEGLRLLPVWDVLMVAWRRRDRLFDPEHEAFLYDGSGNATSVVLEGGRVVGVWDLGREDDPLEVRVAPLGSWSEARWRRLERQAARITRMIGASDLRIVRCGEPLDLRKAPRNRFLSPLKESSR